MKLIRYRDWHQEVATAKQALADHGFWEAEFRDPLFCAHMKEAVTYFQQCNGLDDDGVVGDDTWKVLLAMDDPQELGDGPVPQGLTPERIALLHEALDHVGTKEVPNGSNAGPVEKFMPGWARPEEGEKGPAWCAFFTNFVVRQALGQRYTPHIGSVKKCWERADGRGQQVFGNPTPGDAFVLLNGNGTGHIGLVLQVSDDGETFNTVEGNCRNQVLIGRRSTLASNHIGFINWGLPACDFERGQVEALEVGRFGTR